MEKNEPLFINKNEIKSVIFDMDGTLIDSTGIWHQIDIKFFAKRGIELPKDYAQHIVHLGLRQAAKYTKETYNLEESIQDIMNEWHAMSFEMYQKYVPLKEGALELLNYFKEHNIIMSIATANDEELYMPCLERLGIKDYFSFIADVNNAKEGKQSAKIYLDLAKRMDTLPENTLVLEDMPTCVKTAYKNNFITIAVYDESSKDYDLVKKENSHLFINNFYELLQYFK